MKKYFIVILILIGTCFTARSQSVYHFSYRLLKTGDTTNYDVFFMINEMGQGQARVKYRSPENGDAILVEMDVKEQIQGLKDNELTKNKLYYQLTGARFLKGTDRSQYKPPVFWFKKDMATEYFEPWGASMAITDEDGAVDAFTSVEFFETKADLKKNKPFVKEYFTAKDDFYNQLFESSTRGEPNDKYTKLILIVVANIKDSLIGDACAKDRDRAIKTFTSIKMLLGIQLDTIVISGDSYNLTNVNNAINNIKPGPNDIVVFYYSGHGFRYEEDKRPAPYIDLRAKIETTRAAFIRGLKKNSLNTDDILQRIRKKGARFNLVITDCCNSHLEEANEIAKPVIAKPPPKKRGDPLEGFRENARTLFMKDTMSILATGASPTQKSACNPKFGGFFSYFLKSSIEDQLSVYSKNVSWDNVKENTIKQTVDKAQHTYCDAPVVCEQTPLFIVYPGGIKR